MLYYRVPTAADQKRIPGRPGCCFIGGELFTATECKKWKINPAQLEPVEISPRACYRSFGARFESGNGPAKLLHIVFATRAEKDHFKEAVRDVHARLVNVSGYGAGYYVEICATPAQRAALEDFLSRGGGETP